MLNLSFNFNLFNSYYYFYERLLILLFSLVPSLILVVFVLYTDRKSKEPFKNIIICLLSGILTVSLAGYIEQLIVPYFSNNTVLTYVFSCVEELCKLAIFYLFIFDNIHYDDIYDGIIYMALIALSFAGLENILYAFSENTVSNSINLAIMRDFTTIPLHIISGIVMGYFLSLGNFSKIKNKKYINFILGILLASIIHGTYNFLMNVLGDVRVNPNDKVQVLFTQALPLILIMFVLFIIAFKVCKDAIKLNNIYINNEVYSDKYKYLMTQNDYLNSSQRIKRIKVFNKISFRKNKDYELDDKSKKVNDKLDEIFNSLDKDMDKENKDV